jgi:hypothetical protein
MNRCEGSYRKGVEIMHGIHKKGVHPKDQKLIREFITGHIFKED